MAEGSYCKYCECGIVERPCRKCVQFCFQCKGGCCDDIRQKEIEQYLYGNIGDGNEGEFCKHCACGLKRRFCVKCVELKFQCEGTCCCCEKYREKMKYMYKGVSCMNSFCEFCACKLQYKAEVCVKCVNLGPHCNGRCSCCEEYRSTPRMDPGEVCKECKCEHGNCPCTVCKENDLSCPGTCPCCSSKRAIKAFIEYCKNLKGVLSKTVLECVHRLFGKPEDSSTASESVSHFHPYDSFCKFCECREGNFPCKDCRQNPSSCRGTCFCCMKDPSEKTSSKGPTVHLSQEVTQYFKDCAALGFCKDCQCGPEKSPCWDCVKGVYNCPGTCNCCEEHRKEAASQKDSPEDSIHPVLMSFVNDISEALESCKSSSTSNSDDGFCKDCQCGPEKSRCGVCMRSDYSCPGTCICCDEHRKGKVPPK